VLAQTRPRKGAKNHAELTVSFPYLDTRQYLRRGVLLIKLLKKSAFMRFIAVFKYFYGVGNTTGQAKQKAL
jgi:hypothetical protein